MTTNRQPRRLRRQVGDEGASGEGAAANLSISERLRAAREARGVDLFRVERDTKIRMKYLAAMEQGDFAELPADVYARGFLRNYASYLGLDPDEAESEWRRGNIAPVKPPVKTPPVKTPPVKTPVKMPVKMPPVKPRVVPVDGAAASGRLSGFKLPSVKWSPFRAADAAPAAPKPAPTAPRPVPSDPSILESPPWKRLSFSPGIGAFFHKRDENGVVEPVIGGPQPIAMPGRSLVLQPIHVVLLLLAVVIVAVLLFFSNQAARVLQNPTLTVTSPAGGLENVPVGSTSYMLEGKSTPKAEINISWDLRAPTHTQADASGNWSYSVPLHSGNNQFDISSTDLETTHDSATVTRIINVLTPTASPVTSFLSVDSPTDGEGFVNGNITVSGTTVAVTSVTVTVTYLGPAPSSLPTPTPVKTAGAIPTAQATIMPPPTATPLSLPTPTPKPTPTSSSNPAPVQVIPQIDGKFSAQVQLSSGRWKLTVVGTTADGITTAPVVRNVIVTAGSLVVMLQVRGGDALMRIWQDGKVMGSYNNTVVHNGANIKIVANQSVWFYANWPNHVLVTVNGVSFGRLTTGHTATSWRITAFEAPTPSNDR